jgi:Fanconi-associated nuclease 1
MLRVETGKEVYPKYTINRSEVIYKTRDDLINYTIAFKLENDILSAIERKAFDLVVNNFLNRAKQLYSNAIKESNDSLLPPFLRRYSAGHTYIRCLSHCVNVLEQKKNHSEAVHILKDILLSQSVYCQDYRGRWFERLALNLEKHLKDPKSALTVIEDGLKDEFVRTGHKFALYLRRKNLQKSLKTSIVNIPEFDSIKYAETVIFAETVKYSINDRKHIFKTTQSNGDVTVMPVEDIVLEHYRNNGFTDGLHTEGRVYHTLFALLFWDIIYMSDSFDVFDAFRFNFQRLPLDFNSDEFFLRRKTQILSLLRTLEVMDETQINNILENTWNCNQGIASLVNWDNVEIDKIKVFHNN